MKGTKICKVCGIEYPYCNTVVKDGVFRYQDVACCPEHGSEYLRQIIASRTPKDDAKDATVVEEISEQKESTPNKNKRKRK